MPTCILHVGMPKTGTTSIQESLYFGLEDPRFTYLSLGHPNAVLFLEPLLADNPERFWVFKRGQFSVGRIHRMRERYESRARMALRRAKSKSRTPIISAERLWNVPPAYLERLRDFLASEGFRAKVVAYVRPVKSWFESCFQERTRWAHGSLDALVAQIHPGDGGVLRWWSGRLASLEGIFGPANVTVRPFVQTQLADGCVVRDFCRVIGMQHDPQAVVRSNDSASADAVKFIYAYHRWVPGAAELPVYLQAAYISRLQALRGHRLRFHSALFAPACEAIEREVRTLRDRYGIDLSENLQDADDGPCVRDESDLMRYSRDSLQWLADVSRSAPVESCEGEAASAAVAEQVARLFRRPSWRAQAAILARGARTRLRWLRCGD